MKSRKLYNRVALLREERGLTRKQLADLVGANYQTIGYIERGEYNPSLDLAFKFCEVFGLPIEIIFSTSPFKSLSEVLLAAQDKKET